MATRKQSGQVFTPHYLVCDILDATGYVVGNIRKKHIIDNSCGDGAFLTIIVERYISEFMKKEEEIAQLKIELETYIHGIELDRRAYSKCINNLNKIAKKYRIKKPYWDIINADAMSVDKYKGKMDFVVGNPPYVRERNITNYNIVRSFRFAAAGMTNLFLVFFEIGFLMLKKGGRLCYITPRSWIESKAGATLRQYVLQTHNLVKIIDMEHYRAFRASTYTLISLFEKDVRHTTFTYQQYQPSLLNNQTGEQLTIEQTMINGKMYLASRQQLDILRQIKTSKLHRFVQVKNGFATLADNVFIASCFPFSDFTIPVIKASTGKWYKAFYPYDKLTQPLSYLTIFSNPQVAKYLKDNKHSLLKGKNEYENPKWYLFGRTQALRDVYTNKYAISPFIRDTESIRLTKVPIGCGVYSGLYIITEVNESLLREVLYNQDFIDYLATLKKYQSGGYYTFSSKELETYINYKLSDLLDCHI